MYKYLIHTLDPPPMSPKDPDMKRAPAYKSAWKELDFKFTVLQNSKCPPYTDFGENVKHNGEDCQSDPDALASEPFPHVFRHGVNARRHVHRNEEPTKE